MPFIKNYLNIQRRHCINEFTDQPVADPRSTLRGIALLNQTVTPTSIRHMEETSSVFGDESLISSSIRNHCRDCDR
jgi:hypothetical protein